MPKVVFIGFGLAALLCLLLGNAALFAWFIIRKRSKGLFTFHFVSIFFFVHYFDRLFIERRCRFVEVLWWRCAGIPRARRERKNCTHKNCFRFAWCIPPLRVHRYPETILDLSQTRIEKRFGATHLTKKERKKDFLKKVVVALGSLRHQ